jgi:CBS domain-containing protein
MDRRMTTDVITVDPNTTVQSLAALLAERGISGAPVVDAEGRLVLFHVIFQGGYFIRG